MQVTLKPFLTIPAGSRMSPAPSDSPRQAVALPNTPNTRFGSSEEKKILKTPSAADKAVLAGDATGTFIFKKPYLPVVPSGSFSIVLPPYDPADDEDLVEFDLDLSGNGPAVDAQDDFVLADPAGGSGNIEASQPRRDTVTKSLVPIPAYGGDNKKRLGKYPTPANLDEFHQMPPKVQLDMLLYDAQVQGMYKERYGVDFSRKPEEDPVAGDSSVIGRVMNSGPARMLTNLSGTVRRSRPAQVLTGIGSLALLSLVTYLARPLLANASGPNKHSTTAQAPEYPGKSAARNFALADDTWEPKGAGEITVASTEAEAETTPEVEFNTPGEVFDFGANRDVVQTPSGAPPIEVAAVEAAVPIPAPTSPKIASLTVPGVRPAVAAVDGQPLVFSIGGPTRVTLESILKGFAGPRNNPAEVKEQFARLVKTLATVEDEDVVQQQADNFLRETFPAFVQMQSPMKPEVLKAFQTPARQVSHEFTADGPREFTLQPGKGPTRLEVNGTIKDGVITMANLGDHVVINKFSGTNLRINFPAGYGAVDISPNVHNKSTFSVASPKFVAVRMSDAASDLKVSVDNEQDPAHETFIIPPRNSTLANKAEIQDRKLFTFNSPNGTAIEATGVSTAQVVFPKEIRAGDQGLRGIVVSLTHREYMEHILAVVKAEQELQLQREKQEMGQKRIALTSQEQGKELHTQNE